MMSFRYYENELTSSCNLLNSNILFTLTPPIYISCLLHFSWQETSMVCSMKAKFSWKIKSPWKNQMADEWFVGTPRCSSCLLMCTHKYIMEAGEPLFDFFCGGENEYRGNKSFQVQRANGNINSVLTSSI